MSDPHDLLLIAALAGRLAELGEDLDALERQPGPKGDTGPPGVDAKPALDGRKGDRGTKGDKGDKGPAGDVPDHEWDGSRLRFRKPGGRWGAYSELRGPRGAGGGGGGSSSATFDPDSLLLADGTVPSHFIVRQAGGWRRATYAQVRAWLPSAPAVAQAVTVNGAGVTVGGANVTVTL